MPSRNPSEYFRLIEEREELIQAIRSTKFNRSKSVKESMLAELRNLDGLLGMDSGNYNSPEFGK